MDDRITFAQAADLLGCHVSNIPKLIERGKLTRHLAFGRKRGYLSRTDVEDLAEARRASALKPRVYVRPGKIDRRPDTKHEWLTPSQAGRLVGITAQGIHKRIHRQRLPAVIHHDRWWIRRDHLEQIEAARLAQTTRRP